MELSTYEAWDEEERQDQERLAATHPDYVQDSVDDQRAELLLRFPYTVVATGIYPEHDYARRWCWQNISPENGPCDAWQSEYPACPLVLAAQPREQETWKRKRHTDPGNHEHEGEWSFLWLGKTDYDFGYGEYCFGNESDRGKFLAAFPAFTWSEGWNKEGR
jgi:hypothetical protein